MKKILLILFIFISLVSCTGFQPVCYPTYYRPVVYHYKPYNHRPIYHHYNVPHYGGYYGSRR